MFKGRAYRSENNYSVARCIEHRLWATGACKNRGNGCPVVFDNVNT